MLSGYEPQKRVIEEMLLQPLQHPEIFDSVAQGTRCGRTPPPPPPPPRPWKFGVRIWMRNNSPSRSAHVLTQVPFAAGACSTRPASNRPRAVLFEGPPGTGKTTSAR